jgi:VanZ family protein
MVLIFYASAHPKSALPNYGAYDWDVKKLAHVLIYGALAITYLHALAPRQRPTWRQAVAAIVLAGLYGATDEFHQSFVAGRGAGPVDVGIDTFGATLGVLLAVWLTPRLWRGYYSNSSSANSSSFHSLIDNN